jgi:uncharacterized membrane protein (DUF106 family)
MIPLPLVVVIAVAIAYAAGALLLQRRLTNPKRMREIQRRLKEHSKNLSEMVKSGAPKETIAAKQKEVMPLFSESMRSQMKPLLVVLPLFIVLYYALLPLLIGGMGASSSTISFIFPNLTYENFFFIVVFIFGMSLSIGVMVYDRKKGKQEELLEKASPPARGNV